MTDDGPQLFHFCHVWTTPGIMWLGVEGVARASGGGGGSVGMGATNVPGIEASGVGGRGVGGTGAVGWTSGVGGTSDVGGTSEVGGTNDVDGAVRSSTWVGAMTTDRSAVGGLGAAPDSVAPCSCSAAQADAVNASRSASPHAKCRAAKGRP